MDSSPQGGYNWLMAQLLWIAEEDLLATFFASHQLVMQSARLRGIVEQGFVLDEAEIQQEIALAKAVATCVHRHPCPPVGLGRGDLLHELHALYHALFLEVGDPRQLSWVSSCICAITSDRGVEAGYPQAPAFAFHDMFPYFLPAQVMQVDGADFSDNAPGLDGFGIETETHRLCLQEALPIPGCLHIVHNATRHMLGAMPHFEQKVRVSFSALVDFLHKKFTRQRFIATCIEPFPEARVFLSQLNSFPHTVVKWRFGTLAAVCKDLVELEVPLRRFWNGDRLNFQQAPQQHQDRAEPSADGAFGDDRLQGPSISKATEAVMSNTFWSWVHMVCSLAHCIGHMENWFESCPCHSDVAGRERIRLFGSMQCPLKNFRAPELACQKFVRFLEEIGSLSAAEVVFKHTRFCTDEERS